MLTELVNKKFDTIIKELKALKTLQTRKPQ